MMKMKGRRNRNSNAGSGELQTLKHLASFVPTGTAGSLQVGTLGVINLRPYRPSHILVEYASPTPRTFTYQVSNAAGEPIYSSPLLMAGVTPKKHYVKFQNGIDFGTSAGTQEAVRFNQAAASGIVYALNVTYQYKNVTPSNV